MLFKITNQFANLLAGVVFPKVERTKVTELQVYELHASDVHRDKKY